MNVLVRLASHMLQSEKALHFLSTDLVKLFFPARATLSLDVRISGVSTIETHELPVIEFYPNLIFLFHKPVIRCKMALLMHVN